MTVMIKSGPELSLQPSITNKMAIGQEQRRNHEQIWTAVRSNIYHGIYIYICVYSDQSLPEYVHNCLNTTSCQQALQPWQVSQGLPMATEAIASLVLPVMY